MGRRITNELVIPATEARSFIVKRSQSLRIIAIEGKRVPDVAIFNEHNPKETFDATLSVHLNSYEGIGNNKRLAKLYSKPPRCNVMFRVVDDKVGVHYALSGGCCTPMSYKLRGVKGYHRNCFENIAGKIGKYGLTPDDVPDIFNVWMNVDFDENGRPVTKAPLVEKGGYIEMVAEMDCLVVISACPNDITPCNDYVPKPLGVQVYEESKNA